MIKMIRQQTDPEKEAFLKIVFLFEISDHLAGPSRTEMMRIKHIRIPKTIVVMLHIFQFYLSSFSRQPYGKEAGIPVIRSTFHTLFFTNYN
ncbi:hypothetical protein [Sphingobacterium siyangense]|uniref:hypothetical protein n=1 Tax=Sphingobacterium siyangense TaxID=459529 RepID=UPI00289EF5C6|nr:hypothetical protein [Sphingobacterium siyangense]